MKLSNKILALILLLTSIASYAAGFGAQQNLPIDISADSSESALGDGVSILKKNVHIKQGSLEIFAELGKVYTKDSKVVRIELTGSPVTWKQIIPEQGELDAKASKIDYSLADALVILTGDVEIKHPQGELKGYQVRYSLETERFQTTSSGPDDRVHFRINPTESTSSKETQPPKAGKEDEPVDSGKS